MTRPLESINNFLQSEHQIFCLTDNGLTPPSVYAGNQAGAAVVLTSWFTVRFVGPGQYILSYEVLTGRCTIHRPFVGDGLMSACGRGLR